MKFTKFGSKSNEEYEFPYNLEDRINSIIEYIKSIDSNILVNVSKSKNKLNNLTYKLSFINNNNINNDKTILTYGFTLQNNLWIADIT